NAIKDVWRTEERTGLLRGEGSLRNERRADSVLLDVVLHIGALEIELVGRNQVVERQVPLQPWIALPRESVLAVRANPHGVCPRIQFRIADDGEAPGTGDRVLAPCY